MAGDDAADLVVRLDPGKGVVGDSGERPDKTLSCGDLRFSGKSGCELPRARSKGCVETSGERRALIGLQFSRERAEDVASAPVCETSLDTRPFKAALFICSSIDLPRTWYASKLLLAEGSDVFEEPGDGKAASSLSGVELVVKNLLRFRSSCSVCAAAAAASTCERLSPDRAR